MMLVRKLVPRQDNVTVPNETFRYNTFIIVIVLQNRSIESDVEIIPYMYIIIYNKWVHVSVSACVRLLPVEVDCHDYLI
jgi:hypothetical protein